MLSRRDAPNLGGVLVKRLLNWSSKSYNESLKKCIYNHLLGELGLRSQDFKCKSLICQVFILRIQRRRHRLQRLNSPGQWQYQKLWSPRYYHQLQVELMSSFLWNCICNLEENVLWLAKDGVECTIVTNGEVILMHKKMVPDQSRPIIWVTFTILESNKHCSIGHVCSSACIQLSWYSLIFLVEGIPTTSSSATINLPQRQEALNPEEESSVRALYTAFMPQHLQVKTHVRRVVIEIIFFCLIISNRSNFLFNVSNQLS